MVKLDNPVRIARLGKRLSQKQLADTAGIARMTLVAIEEGTTRLPDLSTIDALAAALSQDADALNRALADWHDDQPQFTYDPGLVKQALRDAKSFTDWRKALEPSATRFAAQLRVARATLTGYEKGERANGLPDTITAGLLSMGVPVSVVRELEKLPAR